MEDLYFVSLEPNQQNDLLARASQAINSLTAASLKIMKSYPCPPEMVVDVMDVILVMLG